MEMPCAYSNPGTTFVKGVEYLYIPLEPQKGPLAVFYLQTEKKNGLFLYPVAIEGKKKTSERRSTISAH